MMYNEDCSLNLPTMPIEFANQLPGTRIQAPGKTFSMPNRFPIMIYRWTTVQYMLRTRLPQGEMLLIVCASLASEGRSGDH
jgi:hypothetical protein